VINNPLTVVTVDTIVTVVNELMIDEIVAISAAV
jgi:hypothetical protein